MANCLTSADIQQYVRGRASPHAARKIDEHVSSCVRCRSALRAFSDSDVFKAGDDGYSKATEKCLDETVAADPGPRRTADETASLVDWNLDAAARSTRPSGEHFPTIEGYEITRVVGRGGMGVVYEAVQEKLHRRVALKLLPAVVGFNQPELVTRFQREAAAAAKLHHTNIIPVYDYGESHDGCYYAMELIDGEPLSGVIKRLAAHVTPVTSHTRIAVVARQSDITSCGAESAGDAEESIVSVGRAGVPGGMPYYRRIATWMADIADAVHYAHLQGMIHRDIKPSNLMLAGDGRIIILDFGLVKNVGDESVTQGGSLIGTYRYMSPEQICDQATVGPRSDVYALGATLYELLTLQPAFPATEQRHLLHAVLEREPVAPRKIVPTTPLELQTICLKAMEKSAAARYESAGAMAEDLRRYTHDLPIVARPVGPVGRTVKFVKRHPAATITSLTLLALAIAVVFGFRQWQDAREHYLDGLVRDGVAAYQARKWSQADKNFSEVLARDPTNFRGLVNYAIAFKERYYAEPDPALLDEANDLLGRALQVRPQSSDVWNLKGVILRTGGRLRQAIEAHEEALRLDPDDYAPWVNLGAVYAIKGDLQQAETALIKGVSPAPSDVGANPWHNLAVVQLQLGRPECLTSVMTALDQPWVPKESLWKPSCHLLRAKIHLVMVDYQDVDQALRSAIAADELSGTVARAAEKTRSDLAILGRVKRWLALAQLRNGADEVAIEAAAAAIEYGDIGAYSKLIRAIAFARLGRADEAAAEYHAAQSEWPSALRKAPYVARVDNAILWIDSAAVLNALEGEARASIQLGD